MDRYSKHCSERKGWGLPFLTPYKKTSHFTLEAPGSFLDTSIYIRCLSQKFSRHAYKSFLHFFYSFYVHLIELYTWVKCSFGNINNFLSIILHLFITHEKKKKLFIFSCRLSSLTHQWLNNLTFRSQFSNITWKYYLTFVLLFTCFFFVCYFMMIFLSLFNCLESKILNFLFYS